MKRNFALAIILMVSIPLWLPAQGHEEMTQNAPQNQRTAPSQHPSKPTRPQQMPGMKAPNPPNAPSQEKQSSQMPVPELLKGEAQRPPMLRKDFEDLAMANNPTLMQANDLVRRSAAEARQAGLYPN